MEGDLTRNGRAVSLQQKRTLVEEYQAIGNMSHAMREAGIQSPRTAYLWWRRYCENGAAGLEPRSHARHSQQQIPDNLIQQICLLRQQHPGWGRRQIANALAENYGPQAVSPSGVEAVLRRAKLWKPSPSTPEPVSRPIEAPTWLRGGVDYAELLATVQTGIQLSLRSEARTAARLLYHRVWRPLEDEPALRNRLLRMDELGSWLLGSRLHFGHSLMNSGLWDLARSHLRQTLNWMGEQPHEARIRSWEESGHPISLRRDDIWLGCCHHLALALGKRDPRDGVAYLQSALSKVERRHRPLVPAHISQVAGIERDLAQLKLRLRRAPVREIRQHLDHAQHVVDESGSRGAQAFTHLARAKLHHHLALAAGDREQSTRRQERDQMEQAVEQALQLVEQEQEDRPMRLTLCYVDAAQLAFEHGIPINRRWVQTAADYCVTYGYGHQAQELLAIPGIQVLLSDHVWENLVTLTQSI